MKASIVHSLGSIIPAPFAMPPILTSLTSTAICFGTESVVIIAWAAARLPSAESVNVNRRVSILESIQSTLSGVPITPVEATATCVSLICKRCASDLETLLASANPADPVKAFALPLLAMIARISLLCLRCSRVTMTGAAVTLLVVKTPAAGPPPVMSATPFLPSLIPEALTPRTAQIPPSTMRISCIGNSFYYIAASNDSYQFAVLVYDRKSIDLVSHHVLSGSLDVSVCADRVN